MFIWLMTHSLLVAAHHIDPPRKGNHTFHLAPGWNRTVQDASTFTTLSINSLRLSHSISLSFLFSRTISVPASLSLSTFTPPLPLSHLTPSLNPSPPQPNIDPCVPLQYVNELPCVCGGRDRVSNKLHLMQRCHLPGSMAPPLSPLPAFWCPIGILNQTSLTYLRQTCTLKIVKLNKTCFWHKKPLISQCTSFS